MKGLIFFIALLILPAVSLTDDSVFFTLDVRPSVMIILDCSGSMTWDMGGARTWGDGSDYFPGRDTDGDGLANDSRMYIAKNAIRRILGQLQDRFRWGLLTYPGQTRRETWADWYRRPPYREWDRVRIPWDWTGSWGHDNGNIRVSIAEGCSVHLHSIYSLIDHKDRVHELRGQGGTPIGGALYAARQYFIGEIRTDPARACRRYFNLLISDGEETGWPHHNPHSPYQEASNLRRTMVDGVEYDIQTYVIGIDVPEGSQCLDSIAKLGGTIRHHSARSPAELDSVLDLIVSDILQKSFAFSAPEVPAVRVRQHDKLWIGSFIPAHTPFWKGRLKCYRLTPDGVLPVDSLGVPLEEPIWEAGEKLKATPSASRTILTEMNGALVPFTPAFIDAATLGVDEDSVVPLINWVRGDNDMGWKLGDIFHSKPLAILAPNPFHFEEGYNEFKYTHANRDRIIVVGANDGMLHAFDAGEYIAASDSFTDGSGEEVWAYIPHNLLSRLKYMRISHQYMVDGSPAAADVWIPSGPSDTTKDADEWRTILVCGLRQGGNYYFSLDITDTHNPSFMWEFTDVELGETWSKPEIGKVMTSKDKWVTVFGGGYHPANEKGKALYILDISNGDIIFKYDNTVNSDIRYSFPSAPLSVDIPPIDNFMDRIYIGDVGGQMWRFDVSDSNISFWTGNVIFTAPTAAPGNPIFYPPSLSYDTNDNLWVFFGTGDRADPREGTSFNRIYGVIDRGISLSEAHLEDITLGGSPPFSNGWYIRLDEGEKVLAGSAVLGGTVYFTTYQAIATADPCAIKGLARLYKVDFMQGTFEVDTIGTSLPTTPQITISPDGTLTILVTLADGMLYSETHDLVVPFKESKYWREIRP